MDPFVKRGMKEKGISHIAAAFGHSMAGGRVLMREEAVRLECLLIAAAVILFAVSGAAWWQWAILTALSFWLLMIEALNTAVEMIVDRTSPEISEYGKQTKDLGSFAVFCSLVIYCLYAIWVIADAFTDWM